MSFIDIDAPKGYELGFQDTVDFNSTKYCFKYEFADFGKRCLLAGDDLDVFLKWMMSLPAFQRRFYELIRETDIVAEFYDIDCAMENTSIEEMNALSIDMIEEFLDARNEIITDQMLSRKDIIVLSAHTPTKLSLHIISKRTYYDNNIIQGLVAHDIYQCINQRDCKFNIDTSVYTKNRCFRMYKNHKFDKRNDLILFEPNMYSYADMKDTLVVLTHTDLSSRVKIEIYDEFDTTIMQHHERDEKLTDDLEQLLQQFIEQHPYLRLGLKNRINRVEHTTRKCLTDDTDEHSKENMYWFIRDNSLYVACFCKKGIPVLLGRRKGIHRIDWEPEPFHLGTHSSDDFKSYFDFGNFRTVMDKRRTGRGKSTCAMEYASNFDNVLLIHHRLSLDDDYTNKYPDFVSYQTNVNSPKQTVCYNSLHKIDINKYQVIIIDEIRSILKQSEMKNMMYATHTLFNIFEKTDIPVVMLDANMTEDDIEFIMSFRKDSKPVIIHDPENETDKQVFMYMGEDYNNMIYKIKNAIDNREKIVLIYNRSIESMNAFLSEYKTTHRILHINRYTRSKTSKSSDNWFDDYDIIAYSPTISEGVSINDPRFKDVSAYGLFVSTSSPAESVSQMIARFRAIKTFHVHVNTDVKKSIPIFKTKNDVLEHIQNNLDYLNCNVERRDGKLRIIEDEFCRLYCKNQLELSLDYHNYANTLVQKLINNGYQVYTANLNIELPDENFETQQDELQEKEHERQCNGILNAPMLSYEEINNLKDNISSEEDEMKVEKFMIVSMLNIKNESLTYDIIDAHRKNRSLRTILKNVKNCFCFIRSLEGNIERVPVSQLLQENVQITVDTMEKMTTFNSQKKNATSLTLSRGLWLNKTIQELGFRYLLSSESIPLDQFKESMKVILNRLKTDAQEYKKVCMLFDLYSSRRQREKLVNSFITTRFKNMFAISFEKNGDQVRQRVMLPIQFYDENKEYPNLMGSFILPSDIINEYESMFWVACHSCKEMVADLTEHKARCPMLYSNNNTRSNTPADFSPKNNNLELNETMPLEHSDCETKPLQKRIIDEHHFDSIDLFDSYPYE